MLGLDRCSGKDFSSPVRCNNLGEFVETLTTDANKILGDDASGIVLVLRNAERLRELEANLLPGFVRLQELTGWGIRLLTPSNFKGSRRGLPDSIKFKKYKYFSKCF